MAEEEGGGGGGGCGEKNTATAMPTAMTPAGTPPGSAPGSPQNKVKLLCSHGGKILPRPAEGILKYVGGETRVVSVPRNINFSGLLDGHITVKYQLIPEELDVLVTVKSDEDLRHMFDEYDRFEGAGTSKLRVFLFPANPTTVADNQVSSIDPQAVEQRYIDAINGITRPGAVAKKQPHANGNPSPLGPSSAGSSPKSPESCMIDHSNHETVPQNSNHHGRVGPGMHRVKSSPSISNLASNQLQLQQQQPPHHHHQHCYPNYHQPHQQQQQQHHHHHGYHPPGGQPPERLMSVRSVGRADSWKYQVVIPTSPSNQYPPPISPVAAARHNRGGGGYCSKCTHWDDNGGYMGRKYDMTESRSPA
ncbi:uncharacterized protein LOC127801688 isoform X2 [Diospyros lotus]|uniref:uncharacterized protein LOC127801688 isoform X2 n=1 Tax=Diospyros lotus TaxID=55363 RepID=UPI0022568F00|nr:uncharacterized protein LOC127801688 isoform X2 [Diospyros lotus]